LFFFRLQWLVLAVRLSVAIAAVNKTNYSWLIYNLRVTVMVKPLLTMHPLFKMWLM
jgi:hypothetical protein